MNPLRELPSTDWSTTAPAPSAKSTAMSRPRSEYSSIVDSPSAPTTSTFW